jgi:hypothetical protein
MGKSMDYVKSNSNLASVKSKLILLFLFSWLIVLLLLGACSGLPHANTTADVLQVVVCIKANSGTYLQA